MRHLSDDVPNGSSDRRIPVLNPRQRPSWVVIRATHEDCVSACARGRRKNASGAHLPCAVSTPSPTSKVSDVDSSFVALTRARSRGSRAALSCKMRESGASRTRTRARAQNMPAFSVTRRLAYRRRTASALSTSCACERRCRQARRREVSRATRAYLKREVVAPLGEDRPREGGVCPGGPAARLPTGALLARRARETRACEVAMESPPPPHPPPKISCLVPHGHRVSMRVCSAI